MSLLIPVFEGSQTLETQQGDTPLMELYHKLKGEEKIEADKFLKRAKLRSNKNTLNIIGSNPFSGGTRRVRRNRKRRGTRRNRK
jgi:hypothetical protein